MNNDDELSKTISDALKGEIDRLPPEGGHVDLRIKVSGDYVGGNKTVIVTPRPGVPEGNPNRRDCPQCGGTTWLATRECIHCDYDLVEHDQRIRREQIMWRRMKVAGFCGLVSALAFYGQSHVPEAAKLWVMGVGILAMIAAVGVMKD